MKKQGTPPLTPEARQFFVEMGRKSGANMTPEQRKERARKASAVGLAVRRRNRDERMKGADPC